MQEDIIIVTSRNEFRVRSELEDFYDDLIRIANNISNRLNQVAAALNNK